MKNIFWSKIIKEKQEYKKLMILQQNENSLYFFKIN